jgi:hypothetical protein
MIASTLLFGVSNLQAYIYYMQYPRDWIVYKVSVAVLWVLDAFNLFLTVHAMYYYLVLHYSNIDALIHIVWSFKLQTVMNVPIIVMVQGLYALRLWRLNYRRDWTPRLMPLTVLIGTGIGTVLAVRTCQLEFFTQLPEMAWITYAAFGSAVAVDSVLAAATVYYLRRARGEFDSTNSRIAKLVFWTLSTGVITSVCSLAALIAYALFPHKLFFLAIEFLLTKLYLNSLLAMLNARRSIREGGTDIISLSRSNNSNVPTSPSSPRARPMSVLPSPVSTKSEYIMQPIPMVPTLQVNDSGISVNNIKPPPVARAI